MYVLISHSLSSEHSTHVLASVDHVSATVSVFRRDGMVGVCCHNAANRVWRGPGRTFRSQAEALAAYKSPEMRAIINGALDYAKTAQQVVT